MQEEEKVNLVTESLPLILTLLIFVLLAIFFGLLVQQLREESLQLEKKEKRPSMEKEPKEFLVWNSKPGKYTFENIDFFFTDSKALFLSSFGKK